MVPRADDEISAANVQLELLNMAKSGQLIQIWQSASTTHVQFNLVSQRPLLPGPRFAWGKLSREPQPPSPPSLSWWRPQPARWKSTIAILNWKPSKSRHLADCLACVAAVFA